MSRQIKFRVWSKQSKRFIKSDYFAIGLDGTLIQHNICYSDDPDDTWDDSWNEELDDERYEVQQFTGLLDSQGKEIYEGDIMLYPNGLPYIVKFGEYSHCDLMTVKLNGWHITNQGWEWPLDSVGKVVSNVFETPELLK